MISTFPDLFIFSYFVPFFFRVFLSVFFLNTGFRAISRKEDKINGFIKLLTQTPSRIFVIILGLLEIIGALLLLAGLFTQVTALALSVIILLVIIAKTRNAYLAESTSFYFLLLLVCLSLVITGAGIPAIDYPL
jgi:uncharacterized membrane protein YphA (DoxX/SURF4 family)